MATAERVPVWGYVAGAEDPVGDDWRYGQRLYRQAAETARCRFTWWVWVDPRRPELGAVRFRLWKPRHLLAAWRHRRWSRRWF
jgi:hypothetical protein